MRFLDRLERKFGHLAIPRLTTYLVIGQSIGFVISIMDARKIEPWMLQADLVKRGEYWRLFTFPFVPPDTNILFFFFAMYLLNLMGNALEAVRESEQSPSRG